MAIISGEKKLDLTMLQLRKIPDELFSINDLEELRLNDNRLGSFPIELTEIYTLRTLQIAGNGIREIPSEIGRLKELRQLDLGSNELKNLPSAIGQLRHLRVLACRTNKLTELPEAVCDLKNLENFWLRENRIGLLPERIGELNNLKDLDLRDNSLSRLPKSLGQLESLAANAKIEGEVGYGLVLDRNPLSEPIRNIVATTTQPETTQKILEYLRSGSIGEGGSVVSPAHKEARLEIQHAYTLALGVRNQLIQELERLHNSRPNSVPELENWSQKEEILEQLKPKIDKIVAALSVGDGYVNDHDAIRQTSELSSEISRELRKWIVDNKVEVVDWFFRLPVAAVMIGLLNTAGASMLWATPVVLAAVGGKNIKNFIKDIANSVKLK